MIRFCFLKSLFMETALKKHKNCLTTPRRLPDDCPTTARRLPDDCPTTARRLPHDCPTTVLLMTHDCPTTRQPYDYLSTSWQLLDGCLTMSWGSRQTKNDITKYYQILLISILALIISFVTGLYHQKKNSIDSNQHCFWRALFDFQTS